MGAGPTILDLAIRQALDGSVDVTADSIEINAESRGEISSAFELHAGIARSVARCLEERVFPIVLSGNCNSAVGTIGGLASHAIRTRICWFDAHADFHTPETTTSGFLDGMALSMVTDRCWKAMRSKLPVRACVTDDLVALCGARDVDEAERDALERSDICRIAANDSAGLDAWLAGSQVRADCSYIHVDLDALDISEGRANDFACGDGYTAAGLVDAIRAIVRRGRVGALSLTAYDPSTDATRTIAAIATRLALSVISQID
jgi:arginase